MRGKNVFDLVHDELDIDPGQLRVKFGGGDNGHNGLKAIRKSLGSGDYFRVRIGVGRPPGRQDPADYLLSNFPASAGEAVQIEIGRAADAVESLVLVGLALIAPLPIATAAVVDDSDSAPATG